MKKVWLVSHYAMPPHLEQRAKTIKYAEYLQQMGYEVLLITASTIHNTDINLIEDKSKFIEKTYNDLHYVHIKCNQYNGSGVKRVYNLIQFQHRFGKVMKKFENPDVIVCDCNCINYFGIMRFARKKGIKFISEIRDLWPLSIVEYMGIGEKNPIIKFLYKQELRMYRLSDAIIFSMEGGKDYILEKHWEKKVCLDKIFNINNGVDLAEFNENANAKSFFDDDLESDKFKVLYLGSIRKANDLDILISSAKKVQELSDKIVFLIYGDGTDRARLEQRCIDEKIGNVVFKGSVNKSLVPFVLSKSNLNSIIVKPTGVMKYGCSLNKLFDYFASGKPIISNLDVKYDLILRYKCGSVTSNMDDYADEIIRISNLSKENYDVLCENSLRAARDYDYKELTKKLENALEYAFCNKKIK